MTPKLKTSKPERITTDCPFCYGDIDGCCFCDHSGKIYIGKGYVFESINDLKPFQKEYVKESDLRKLFDMGAFEPKVKIV